MPSSAARSLSFLLILLATIPAFAHAADGEKEVRQLKLADGRVLTGLVLEANADGMEIQVPQGLITISYGSLAEVEVLEAESYAAQAPLRVGLAPTIFRSDRDKAIAHDVDQWLAELVSLVPQTEVLSAREWAQGLAGRGTNLHRCAGEASCLRPLATELNLDRLIIPRLDDGSEADRTLGLSSVVVATGSTLRPSFSALRVEGSSTKPSASSAALLEGTFGALGFRPTIDTSAVAQAAFSADETEDDLASRGALTTPATPKVLTPVKRNTSTITAKKLDVKPIRKARTTTPQLQLSERKTFALSFLPVPGLAAALERDRGGFVLSLVGTIALSWVTVYAAGRVAHSPDAFWGPSVLGSYAICVGFNQISLALLRGRRAKIARSGNIKPQPRAAAGFAPLLSAKRDQPAEPSGASLVLSGSF